jgi:hypothetical protein
MDRAWVDVIERRDSDWDLRAGPLRIDDHLRVTMPVRLESGIAVGDRVAAGASALDSGIW